MGFSDHNYNGIHQGVTNFTGLGISKTGAMTLEVAAGSVDKDGTTHVLSAAQNHIFSSNPAQITRCWIALIEDGAGGVDIWVDEFVSKSGKTRGNVPGGWNFVCELAWFDIAAGETDLDNATIVRRLWT